MPVGLADWLQFRELTGSFRIQRESGEQIAYAASGVARGYEKVARVWKPADIELVLYDEMRKEIGSITGDKVVRFETDESPVILVVVDDSNPAEEGPSVTTRGSQSTADRA